MFVNLPVLHIYRLLEVGTPFKFSFNFQMHGRIVPLNKNYFII